MVTLAMASLGWFIHAGAVWIVSHERVNYRLGDYGLQFLSHSAETFNALGSPFTTIGGVLLALPVAAGCARNAVHFKALIALSLLHWLLIMWAIDSDSVLVAPFWWIGLMIWAIIDPARSTQRSMEPSPLNAV